MSISKIKAPSELEAYSFELAGEPYVMLSFAAPRPHLPDGLTEIERQIVGAVLDGLSNDAIAQIRKRSTHTVANQLRRVYRKLGVDGRNALIALCARG